MIKFTVAGKPQPKQRARVTRRGTFTPKATKAFEAAVSWAALSEARRWRKTLPMTGPLQVDIVIVLKRPKRLQRKTDPDGLIWAPVRPDADNIRKAVLDGLDGVIVDDGQVVSGSTAKVFAEKGGEARTVVMVGAAGSVLGHAGWIL